ncbi:DUF1553 domain-containing protein [bacterium]|nr:DUF1553 domain-containing protein [bacterium]
MQGGKPFFSHQGLRRRFYFWALMIVNAVISRPMWAADPAAIEHFESQIRPLLVEKCVQCHGSSKQEGSLRLDSREGLLTGGDTGTALHPGRPEASLILDAVRQTGDLQMPPNGKLSDAEIIALAEWIKLGAPWPESTKPLISPAEDKARAHWSFQPVKVPSIPEVTESAWVRTPLDAFVLAKIEQAGLTHAPSADPRTLVRRLHHTLTGLPPSPEVVEAFVADPSDEAYAQLVDQLLDSPQYGEHLARMWLDLARYSDTKGYVYAREERFWIHAWNYRDWVVAAFNRDLPYNRFLILQLAADQVEDAEPGDSAAMGFLTIGRRFLGVPWDIIDDRIDAVCRSTMALTASCARCHDHKYDPIPTADYYSLYGVFDSCAEHMVALQDHAEAANDEELQKRQQILADALSASRRESSDRARSRLRDYLFAQTELDKYPAQGFDQVFEKSDMLPAFVRRWETYLYQARRNHDPVWLAWQVYADLTTDSFRDQAADVTATLQRSSAEQLHPAVRVAFVTAPKSFTEVIDRYADIFAAAEERYQLRNPADEQAAISALSVEPVTPADQQLFDVLHGPAAPCEVPDLSITHTETFFDSATVNQLWKLQGDVDRWLITTPTAAAHALILVDREVPAEPRVLKRGNPLNKGADVPRQFLSILAGANRTPFQHGSGRFELARAIVDPENPLTARVIVNRLWAHVFGQGLVTTPSDFGLRCDPPSHPELLDWLAHECVSHGWSLKTLVREMVLSSTYRQSSMAPESTAAVMQIDPENRLLTRMNRQRLSFEEFRDGLLAASGELDRVVGGKPVDLLKAPYPHRRTLYGLVDRQFLPATFRIFDFANPDLHTPERSETTVPQQALFALNHPVALERVRALAQRGQAHNDPAAGVREMFRQTLLRAPNPNELQEALAFLDQLPTETPAPRPTAVDWQYGFASYDEEGQQVQNFTALPHFTGTAWQGGPNWPDSQLGWVQLTATGGHPGNDRAHAAVRRWTAPRSMTIQISSQLVHEPAAGDGIRAFMVSSRSRQIAAAKVHQQTHEFSSQMLTVEAGEILDFVVDIGDVLNSDQYLWQVALQEVAAGGESTVWNSQQDFPETIAPHLNPWEQLAQILFCTNEFLFVD